MSVCRNFFILLLASFFIGIQSVNAKVIEIEFDGLVFSKGYFVDRSVVEDGSFQTFNTQFTVSFDDQLTDYVYFNDPGSHGTTESHQSFFGTPDINNPLDNMLVDLPYLDPSGAARAWASTYNWDGYKSLFFVGI